MKKSKKIILIIVVILLVILSTILIRDYVEIRKNKNSCCNCECDGISCIQMCCSCAKTIILDPEWFL